VKARSAEEFADRLRSNLAPRKQELSSMKLLIDRERRSRAYGPLLLRAATPLLYAHLEGFVKFAANAYLEFVNFQSPKYADLIPSLAGLALRSRIAEAQQSEFSHGGRTKLMEFVLGNFTDKAELPLGPLMGNPDDKDAVSTSNLKWKVLSDILGLLGLSTTTYETKKALLEEKLLKTRNEIAHGLPVKITVDDYEELHGMVIELLDYFHNDVVNAAVRQTYLRAPAASPPAMPPS